MQDITADKLQIAYDGPLLKQGRMPMDALGNGLRGHALMVRRVALLMYGERYNFQVEVDPSFESGSLLVPVHILSNAFQQVEILLAGKEATALANLLQILGFGGVLSLYHMFKRLKGRRIASPEDLPPNDELTLDISIELLIKIYNDNEVQQHLRQTISPLRDEGVQEFQTRREGVVYTRIDKADLLAADEAEVSDLVGDEEIELGIEKAAWRRNLAWHLNDGQISFDARIDDAEFWKRVEQGEPFAVGDRMRVHLRTTARRKENGTLKIERRIPHVIEVEHAKRLRTLDMFENDEERD
jgi:hypothetical protein